MRISDRELAQRRERLLERAPGGFVLFGPDAVRYFTDFWFLSNERPIAYAELPGGESFVFVPEFEVERTRAETSFARIESYPEYPGLEHPMLALAKLFGGRALGADSDGYPGILGYAGPALSDVTGAPVTLLGDAIERMMRIKSPAEIELIRESGRWCAHAHRLLQEYTRPGVTEADVSLRVAQESTLAMLDAHGQIGQLGSADGVKAGYRGQIGARSSWAHAIAHRIQFAAGDMLVTETGAPVWGYNAELERGMVIGPPTDHQKWMFEHTVAAQQVAFDALRPGVTCADVDGAVMRYFTDNDLLPYWRQHTGHGIGLRNHEAPFLDVGDDTPIEAGMVFTIEPGLYDDGGGFRHSDTVVVTDDGIELLTDYPRDLESLTLPTA